MPGCICQDDGQPGKITHLQADKGTVYSVKTFDLFFILCKIFLQIADKIVIH